MSDSLRPAWVIANKGQRLLNMETGMYFEQSALPNVTHFFSDIQHPHGVNCEINHSLDKIIKAMNKQGLILKLL